MKKLLTWLLLVALVFAVAGCGADDASDNDEVSEDVKEFEELVEDIGKVTVESGDAIKAAEEAYDALSRKEKRQTDKDEELEKMRETYDRLVEDAKVTAVEEKIDAIGEVTIESSAQLDEAQEAYDALSEENKEKVKNIDKLNQAAEDLKKIKEEQAELLLSSMRVEEDKVRSLTFYYPQDMKFYSNGTWAADISCFAMPYIGKDANSSWLRLLYNYTGDDWVFFKSLIIAVDGEQYNKSFNYYDIVRDNGGGDVWEYIDIEASEEDIEMLWAIANSQETIIRFQGDDYSHDYTVTESNKRGIREALTAYEALN